MMSTVLPPLQMAFEGGGNWAPSPIPEKLGYMLAILYSSVSQPQ